jgi:hypothetical protein
MYASFLGISGAWHLAVFDQPAWQGFFRTCNGAAAGRFIFSLPAPEIGVKKFCSFRFAICDFRYKFLKLPIIGFVE